MFFILLLAHITSLILSFSWTFTQRRRFISKPSLVSFDFGCHVRGEATLHDWSGSWLCVIQWENRGKNSIQSVLPSCVFFLFFSCDRITWYNTALHSTLSLTLMISSQSALFLQWRQDNPVVEAPLQPLFPQFFYFLSCSLHSLSCRWQRFVGEEQNSTSTCHCLLF